MHRSCSTAPNAKPAKHREWMGFERANGKTQRDLEGEFRPLDGRRMSIPSLNVADPTGLQDKISHALLHSRRSCSVSYNAQLSNTVVHLLVTSFHALGVSTSLISKSFAPFFRPGHGRHPVPRAATVLLAALLAVHPAFQTPQRAQASAIPCVSGWQRHVRHQSRNAPTRIAARKVVTKKVGCSAMPAHRQPSILGVLLLTVISISSVTQRVHRHLHNSKAMYERKGSWEMW
jgi:hypothetical protein